MPQVLPGQPDPGVKQLATDVLTLTLHGPPPMETVAKLAQGVIDLSARVETMQEIMKSPRVDTCDDIGCECELCGEELDNLRGSIASLEEVLRQGREMVAFLACTVRSGERLNGEDEGKLKQWFAACDETMPPRSETP